MNLLPDTRKKSLARLYLVRVAVVGTLLLSLVLFIHVVLGLPTLLLAKSLVAENAAELAALTTRLAGSEDKQVGQRIATLNTLAEALTKTAETPSVSDVVRAISALPHSGVRITSLSYARDTAGTANRMTLTGTAASREALRTYVATLSGLPYVKSVDLPISAYAKETDITFTITLIGTLAP